MASIWSYQITQKCQSLPECRLVRPRSHSRSNGTRVSAVGACAAARSRSVPSSPTTCTRHCARARSLAANSLRIFTNNEQFDREVPRRRDKSAKEHKLATTFNVTHYGTQRVTELLSTQPFTSSQLSASSMWFVKCCELWKFYVFISTWWFFIVPEA